MSTLRPLILQWADRLQAAILVALIVGAAFAFGGAVWWWRPVASALALALVSLGLVRVVVEGRARVRLSPIPLLGVCALGIAVVQLAPMPSSVSNRIAASSRSAHAQGVLADRVLRDDPGAVLPEAIGSRTPSTLDRSATLRWLFDAGICLVVLVSAARFAERLGRTLVVWGSVIAAFAMLTGFGFVQLLGDTPGLWGFLEPGRAPFWAPSTLDLLRSPGTYVLRPLAEPDGGIGPWLLPRPDRDLAIGGTLGGSGAFLAFAALGLPLSMAVMLQVLAPRGSREPILDRIGRSGVLPLAIALGFLTAVGAGLVGYVAGPLLASPFVVGLLIAGLPSAWGTELRWPALGMTLLGLLAIGGGLAGHRLVEASGDPDLAPITADADDAVDLWRGAGRVARAFPILGSGLGTFDRVYPMFKTRDVASTTAGSSLLQWVVESGAAGASILGLAVLWCLARSIGAWRRVGSADRALAAGLSAACCCFVGFAALHWSVELPAVALAASAVAGTLDRWLSGGTDLFVEAA